MFLISLTATPSNSQRVEVRIVWCICFSLSSSLFLNFEPVIRVKTLVFVLFGPGRKAILKLNSDRKSKYLVCFLLRIFDFFMKTSIEIAEADKGLRFFQKPWSCPIKNGLNFNGVHFQTVGRDFVSWMWNSNLLILAEKPVFRNLFNINLTFLTCFFLFLL